MHLGHYQPDPNRRPEGAADQCGGQRLPHHRQTHPAPAEAHDPEQGHVPDPLTSAQDHGVDRGQDGDHHPHHRQRREGGDVVLHRQVNPLPD